MVVETFCAELAPDAGIADAAPGRGGIEAVMIVDPDDAAFDRGGDAVGAGDIAGADRRRKPERRIVGEPERIRLFLGRCDGSERPEYFFLKDAHVGRHDGEHRRRVNIAVLMAGNPGGGAARDEPGALLAAERAI